LRDAVRQVRARAPFHIDAWVVLPDDMHCLWTPASAGAGYCRKAIPISRAVGARSRKGFRKFVRIGEPRSPVMIRRSERGMWQRRYWEHTIRDEQDFVTHFD
jgi:putative transposase